MEPFTCFSHFCAFPLKTIWEHIFECTRKISLASPAANKLQDSDIWANCRKKTPQQEIRKKYCFSHRFEQRSGSSIHKHGPRDKTAFWNPFCLSLSLCLNCSKHTCTHTNEMPLYTNTLTHRLGRNLALSF